MKAEYREVISDGVVRYMSDGNLLFTKYPDSKYVKQCQSMLKDHFNKMHNFWMPSGGAKHRERFQWAYINYIRLKSATLLKSQSVAAQTAKNAIFLVWTDFLPCVG